MYPPGLARPTIEPVDDDAPLWDVVEDADQPEDQRVVAAWKLAGARDLERVARRLAALLREPTLWLGSEIVEVIGTIAPDLAFGVDARGLLAVSPTPLSLLAAGACATLGLVVPVEKLASLATRTADPLPWLVEPHTGAVPVAWVGYRSYLHATVGTRALPRSGRFAEEWSAMNDFPWSVDAARAGDVIELQNDHVNHRVVRAVVLSERRCGVLSYDGPGACIVDVDEGYREHRFRYFFTYAMGDAFRFRVLRGTAPA